jgi:hypothetical protein
MHLVSWIRPHGSETKVFFYLLEGVGKSESRRKNWQRL